VTASERFTLALVNLAARGERTHCSDAGTSTLWVSDFEAERAQPARLCVGCPVIVECGAAADELGEKWYVWGGKDYGRRSGKRKQAA
jgi:hypothetical protein